MAREKPPEAGVPDWILTYGDMMSLLLCFFIMLYAISTLEVPKAVTAIESLKEGFGYMGSNSTPKDRKTHADKTKVNSSGRAKRLDVLRGGQPVTAPQGDMAKVQTIHVNEEPITGGLIRFELGSDELTPDAKQQLQILYDQLVGSPFKIQVVGHAGPNEQGPYRDVFDFSYARAMNVMRCLVTLGLKEEFFRITPVGASEPISRTVLPPGTNPLSSNAFVEVKLLSDTVRELESDKADRDLKYLNNLPSN